MRETTTVVRSVCACALVLGMQWACGNGGGIFAPNGGEPGTPPAASVNGTWSGGNAALHLVWHLTQDGGQVNGISQARGGDGWNGAGGHVVGKVDGSTFAFNETHAIGTMTIAGCSAEFEGSLQVSGATPPATPPPGRYYPGGPPPTTLPANLQPAFILSMSGYVRGQACGRPFSGVVTMLKN